MLRHWNYRVFFASVLLAATAWAQNAQPPADGGFAPNAFSGAQQGYVPAQPPPPVNSIPGQPAAPGAPPVQGDPQAGANGDGSYFVPVQPSPNYDYFEEEDGLGYDGDGGGSGGGGRSHETKDSFRLVERPEREVCHRWGNSLLGPSTFSDLGKCELELERKVDLGKASINDLYDKMELFKLKKVIRGDIKNRAEAKKYSLNFDSLRKSLSEASRKGCTCLDK